MGKGLGILERWILTHAYLRPTLKRLLGHATTEDTPFITDFPWTKKGVQGLFKMEIMTDYFKLKPIDDKVKATKAYKNAYACFRRATQSLKAKGYIETWELVHPRSSRGLRRFKKCKGSSCGRWLELTKAGRAKAEELCEG